MTVSSEIWFTDQACHKIPSFLIFKKSASLIYWQPQQIVRRDCKVAVTTPRVSSSYNTYTKKMKARGPQHLPLF